MSKTSIPNRSEVPLKDRWDLSTLYKNDDEWESDLKIIPTLIQKFTSFKSHLADSPDSLLGALKAYEDLYKMIEKVYCYASLEHSSDEGDSASQDREGRAMMAYAKAGAEGSFFSPELMAIPDEKINAWCEREDFKDYKIFIQKELHEKPYILSEKEERILSLSAEALQTPSNAFSLLENVDLKFDSVNDGSKEVELTQSTFSVLIRNPDRKIRKDAYKKFYKSFVDHQNVLASLYAGSVNSDVFHSRARGFPSSLEASLYSNKVDKSVYLNLIETVHKNLPALHRYYSLRKKILGVEDLRHYDVYVPLVKDMEVKTSYDKAVELCRNAMAPLGSEYTDTLCNGLLNGWVDRYENKGKRSGAFSSGAYTGYPYILLNYKDDAIRDVFTMAHEGGHSMHSHYSKTNNPFSCYDYTIFEAEVASTFNEELLFEYLLKNADSKESKTYLLAMRADDILATLHRQTMFAEYELKTHQAVEEGIPLNAELLRKIYRELLELYFGKDMVFEEESDMEGLRIPHFYNAFYVYKYATGISAALALAKRVTKGGEKEREDYFKFLKSGGSRYPLESLKIAGVDMSSTEPVQAALDTFAKIVDELEITLKI